jgi:hypothetical protein
MNRTDDSHLFFLVGPGEATLGARFFAGMTEKEWVPNVKIIPLATIEPGLSELSAVGIRLGCMAGRVEPDLLKEDFT